MTGIEYALVTIELVKGEKVIRIDTSDALVNKTQDINFLIDPTKRSVSNFSVQCKLTSKSTTSLCKLQVSMHCQLILDQITVSPVIITY